jgi:hypothetical protein
MQQKLDAFTEGYLTALLWSSVDDHDEPLDKNFSIEDFSKEALAQCVADCQEFQRVCQDYLENADDSHTGHDFCLTRNEHGSGFWDDGGENYTMYQGTLLTMAAHAFGEVNPYVYHDGDDERVICL